MLLGVDLRTFSHTFELGNIFTNLLLRLPVGGWVELGLAGAGLGWLYLVKPWANLVKPWTWKSDRIVLDLYTCIIISNRCTSPTVQNPKCNPYQQMIF